ncbi:toxin-antitoxin system YwqK family antitoxin [Polaribacter sp.]|uniref:toxin-antitoxin system YwqK family antitoxin n=1 Tax=Polaribacter sp. TaxID=1920175 RepID=UPI003EF103D3
MKTSTVLLVLVVGFLTSSLTAQETVWFDSNWKITTKKKAAYYRPSPQKKDNGYWIVDYYISGKKQMEGLSTVLEPNKEKFVGFVNYFYENGAIFQEVYYLEGKPEGKFSEFHDSGELKRSGNYENGLREGNWKAFYKSGKIQEKGKYSKGKKVGTWKTFYNNKE